MMFALPLGNSDRCHWQCQWAITLVCCFALPCLQVLWDVDSGEAICGSPTHSDFVLCCRFFSNQSDKLITAGNYNLQVCQAQE